MKEFFEQCLRDLEPLTGIRQLAYLEMEANKDPIEAKRKIDLCVSGMVQTAKGFPYIPEDHLKKIVRESMVTDQSYDSLNSRTIYKWLSLHKDVYWGKDFADEEIISPEKQAEYDKAREKWEPILLAELQKAKIIPALTPEEIQNEGKLRDPMLEELRAKFPKTEPRPKFIIGTRCPDCKGGGVVGDGEKEVWECKCCEGTGEINRIEITAANREEAERAYRATFG